MGCVPVPPLPTFYIAKSISVYPSRFSARHKKPKNFFTTLPLVVVVGGGGGFSVYSYARWVRRKEGREVVKVVEMPCTYTPDDDMMPPKEEKDVSKSQGLSFYAVYFF